jgi:transposase
MWYAGIDWADDHHDLVILDDAGEIVRSLRVTHTATGIHDLIALLRTTVTRPDQTVAWEQVVCVIETSHGLLITALLEAGVPVYPVNPKTVDRRRKPSGAKTDGIDAYLLAKTGRSDLRDLTRLRPDSPLIQELKALTRDQDSLIQTQTRLVNQLTACLKAYFPAALQLFTKLHQPSTLAFLQAYPTLSLAQAATLEEIAAVLRQAHYPHPAGCAKHIWQVLHQPHLQADAVTVRTKMRLMVALLSQLQPLLEQIAAYDAAIAQLFASHPDQAVFASLPRAGKRLAPRLLAEWGDDRARYSSAQSVQMLAGTAPVPFQSGQYAKMHKRSACIKPLRNALIQFAWQSTVQEEWAREYYQRKRREGKSHQMALRALANTWVRIVYALWHKQEAYATETFIAAQQAHERRAA